MQETKIYIGLNDSQLKQQKFETSKYISILKNVCIAYHVPFSLSMNTGSYFHENGEYTEENTLVLTLIDIDKDITAEIARDLCGFFHQESVLVTESNVNAYFVKESIGSD